jgi:excisionase family DNA binding protein
MDAHKTLSDRYLPKEEAADYVGLRPRTLEKLVEKGELAAFKPTISGSHTRKTLFKRGDLDLWMEKHRVPPVS